MAPETKQLLERAAAEIRALRHVNELLTARVETMEVFAVALRVKRQGGIMVSADVMWEIERALADDGKPRDTQRDDEGVR